MRFVGVGLLVILASSACSSARVGWGKGTYRVLFEDGDLQIRRAVVFRDPVSGELVLPWVGARIPQGFPGAIESCRLVVFRDADRDGRVDANEIVLAREAPQPAIKVQFDDVRVPAAARSVSGERLFARIEVKTDRRSKSTQWELTVDP